MRTDLRRRLLALEQLLAPETPPRLVLLVAEGEPRSPEQQAAAAAAEAAGREVFVVELVSPAGAAQ